MQLQQFTGNKQHILAEDTLGNELTPSLCNLYITYYEDCIVLAAFSSLEKKLLAYKVTNPIDDMQEKEQWLNENFNQSTFISYTRLYEITPQSFSTKLYNTENIINRMMVCYQSDSLKSSIHYLTSLIQYHLIRKLSKQIYIFRQSNFYTLLLMNVDTCILANTFKCENENEVLYFLLNTLQISDILPSDTTLNIDYSILNNQELVQFISPHVAKTEILNYTFEGIDPSIPQLSQKLFACYAASLCE